MERTRVELDSKRHRIVFHGGCLEMHPECHAMCCRHSWDVPLTADEHASGRYRSEPVCRLTRKACTDSPLPCLHRYYRLAKDSQGACVYLTGDLCGIYEERPGICSEVKCGGWFLSSSICWPDDHTESPARPPAIEQPFVDRLHDDLVFVPHPLVRVLAVFCRESRKDIVFVKEIVSGSCRRFTSRDDFEYPSLDDNAVMRLIDLFSRREPLGRLYERFCGERDRPITKKEFYEIVWLLNRHHVILDSGNFAGMLSEPGRLQ